MEWYKTLAEAVRTDMTDVRAFLRCLIIAVSFSIVALPAASQGQENYARSTRGTRYLEGNNGLQIKILVESTNLGGTEVDIGEITFPPGPASSPGHTHGAIEILYILSGQLDHIVNGESHLLDPGMVGIVRPEDEVMHRVASDGPVRALVIWAPGGEAERLAQFFRQRPIEGQPE